MLNARQTLLVFSQGATLEHGLDIRDNTMEMSMPESSYDEPEAVPPIFDGSEACATAAQEEDSVNVSAPQQAPEPRWGFWATVGFSLVVLAVFVGLQTGVAIVFVVVQLASSGQALNQVDAAALSSSGLLLSLATFASMPPCLGLVVLAAWLKRGATIRGYLGFQAVSLCSILIWLGLALVYFIAADGLTYLLGRPIVPEVMANAYQTAGFLPLFWAALVVMAPLFEETFFRGFMLEGFRYTRLGAVGAVLVTALVWSAIHIQYDFYQIATIFVGGLLLGTAKLRTGSVVVTMSMHCLQNIVATIETAVYVHLNGNGVG